jgi:hypothetical protein
MTIQITVNLYHYLKTGIKTHESVYVAIACELVLVKQGAILLKNSVLNDQLSASKPPLHLYAKSQIV